jgi:hypothetical protein
MSLINIQSIHISEGKNFEIKDILYTHYTRTYLNNDIN